MAKYDSQSSKYNFTRKADPFLLSRFIHFLSASSLDLILDLGCGTGNYTSEIDRLGYNIVGVDPSNGMLKKAKNNNLELSLRQGTAENIPMSNLSVHRIMASLTLHHWTDLRMGFNEISRVLKPGGKVVIFTSTPKQMENYWLNHYFPKMMEISMDKMPSYELISKLASEQNLNLEITEKYFIKKDLSDLFLYSGKHKPEIYLDNTFRLGVSSFTMDSNKTEIDSGLEKLKRDISRGEIKTVIRNFENNLGDYLFIVLSN